MQSCCGTKYSRCSLGVCGPPGYGSSKQQLEKDPKCVWRFHEKIILSGIQERGVLCLVGCWHLCTSFGSPVTWHTSSCGLRQSHPASHLDFTAAASLWVSLTQTLLCSSMFPVQLAQYPSIIFYYLLLSVVFYYKSNTCI